MSERKNASATTVNDEADLRRFLNVNKERPGELRAVAQNLQIEIRRCKGKEFRPSDDPSVPMSQQKRAVKEAKAANEKRIEDLKQQLLQTEEQIRKLDHEVGEAARAIREIDEGRAARLRAKCANAVDAAVKAAPGRQIAEDALSKLTSVRSELARAEGELDGMFNGHVAEETTPDARGQIYLDSGTLLGKGDVSRDSKTQFDRVRTLTAAARKQELYVAKVQDRFCEEVNDALLAVQKDCVKRIAESYEAARQATKELATTEGLVGSATHSVGFPSHRFAGVPVPTDIEDAFIFWLNEMRKKGLL